MAPAPDVEAAWEQLSERIAAEHVAAEQPGVQPSDDEEIEPRRRTGLLRTIALLATAAAACVLLFFMLKPKDTVKDTTPGITILAQKADHQAHNSRNPALFLFIPRLNTGLVIDLTACGYSAWHRCPVRHGHI